MSNETEQAQTEAGTLVQQEESLLKGLSTRDASAGMRSSANSRANRSPRSSKRS